MARNARKNEEIKNEEKNRTQAIEEKIEKVEEIKYQDEIEEEEKKAKNKLAIIVVFIIIISIMVSIGIFGYKTYLERNKEPKKVKSNVEVKDTLVDLEKVLKIANSQKRIVACMISNEKTAWPQAGLQEAYIIYECLIEGGETRFMALFKENAPAKIGPIRSARHYFVNFMQEHDAIYAHFGWSPLAETAIKSRGVNNINGIYDEYYYREGYGYNNAYSSMQTILKFATEKGYSKSTLSKTLYPYSIEEKYLETDQTLDANKVQIKYSNMQNVSYAYDADKKVYLRSMRGTPHIDKTTRKQLEVKNIVVLYEQYYDLNDYPGSARQQLNQVGSGTGLYITNGRYVKVNWNKSADTAKTKITDENGEEIILNDGLTFIQVVPKQNAATIN